MTEPKRYKRGKHTYTRWGHNFKEVRVEGKKKDDPSVPPTQSSFTIDVDADTSLGVYSNMTMAHHSQSEVVLDFIFIPPGQSRGKVRSRVIVSRGHMKSLAHILNKTVEEITKDER